MGTIPIGPRREGFKSFSRGWGGWGGDGFADLAPAGEIPFVRKVAALGGFYGVDGAVDPVEEDAFAVGFLGEGEAGAVFPEGGEAVDEIVGVKCKKGCDFGDFVFFEHDFSGPAAAVCASLADVVGVQGIRH